MKRKKIGEAAIKKLNKQEAKKHSYHVARPFKHDGVLYLLGEKLEIIDKSLLKLFLRNNLIK